jgi:hypothetical protein
VIINVHIERLILDGLPVAHGERSLVKMGLEDEFAQLLSMHGLPSPFRSGDVAYLRTSNIHIASDTGPLNVGHQIAEKVYQGSAKPPQLKPRE